MNHKEREAARQARIADERRRLRPKPWQFVPSQVYGRGSSPWPPGTAGYASWIEAQAMCDEIIARDPDYFDHPPQEV